MHTRSFFHAWWGIRRTAAKWLRISLALILLCMAFQQAAPAALAATIYSCDAAGLQAALNAGGDAIFNCPSPGGATITLTGSLTVTKNTNLDGSNLLTISTSGNNRIFMVSADVTLGLSNLTIQNGNDTFQGGGVYNLGTLNVSNTTFTGNKAGSGGAIYNGGTLSVTSSNFYTNTAGSYGAAIFNAGSMALSGGTFSGNTTPIYGGAIYNDISGNLNVGNSTNFYKNSAGTGGGIYNYGNLALDTVIFSRNTVTQTGGGLYNIGGSSITISNTQFLYNNAGTGAGFYTTGPATLTNATFTNNSATNSGGGLFTSAALTVAGTSFTSNNAAFAGGGISATTGSGLSIGNSSFYSNTAINGGGLNSAGALNLSAATFSGNGSSSFGGGVYNGGQATIDNAQFLLNTSSGSGGGIYSTGPMTLTNAGFNSNTATYGGAVANLDTQSIQNSTFTLNTAQLEGGSVYNNGNLTISASGFYTGTSSQYGGAIQNFGSVTMSGITFAGNTATSSGGAVYLARNGRAMIDTSTFTNNTATNDSGGGIYLFTGSSLSGSALTFNGNTAVLGGAVRSVAASTITISNSVFTNNKTTTGAGAQGGAFRTDGVTALDTITLTANFGQDGGGIFNGGIATLTNSHFISNTTNGGGAAINNTTGGRLSVDQSLFTLNSSTNNAGALYNNGIFTVTNSTLLTNSTRNSGGAAMNDSGGTMTIGNVGFYTNTANTGNSGGVGGAIYNTGGLNVTNGGFSGNSGARGGGLYSNNSATIINSNLTGNSASQFGGAIMSNASMTISYTDFYSNTASDRGGAIYNHGTLAINADGANKNEIRYNNATNYGGAIYSDAALTIDYTDLFNNTISVFDGGSIYSPGNLTIRNSTLNNNTATRNGGAIFVQGILSADTDTLNSNAATNGNGGAIYNDNLNTSTITNSSFNSNTAGNGNGGAIYNNRGTLTLSRSTPSGSFSLANNQAANGGAIGNASGASLNVDNYLLSQNTAGSGGAIWNNGNLNFTTTTFSLNQAQTGNGGAIISLGSTLTFSNTTFTSNSAHSNGGALDTNGSTVTFNNSQLASNTATNAGGALGIGSSNVTLNNSDASKNSSSGSGGMAVVYGSLTLNNSTVKGNQATANGGAVENNATVTTNSGTMFDTNSAGQSGGAIHNNATATINNAQIVNNSAATGGGIANGGTATVMTTTLANNTATNNGAAIANTGGSLTVQGSTFNDNTAQNGPGGGIYMSSGSGGVNVTNSTFTRNHANPYGAGIANNSTTVTPTLNFVTIMNNFGITNGVSISGGAILKNSIVYYANGPADCNATVVSQGNNVMASCVPAGTNDTPTAPENAPLANNGGPTQTIAQSTSSPAFGRVPLAACVPAVDQRGYVRGIYPSCMSGAFELGSNAPFITDIFPTSANVGNYPNGSFTLDVNGGQFDTSSAQIIWNGTPIATTRYAGGTHLSATITPSMIGAAGTYTVSVTNNHPEYPPPGSYKTFTVNQVQQTVDFPLTFATSILATDPPFDVHARGLDPSNISTNLPVTFTITGSTPPCTVGPAALKGDGYYHATVTITGVINNNTQCAIQATAGGNTTFTAGTASRTVTVKKTDQKVALSGVPTTTQLINGPPFVISATSVYNAPPITNTGLTVTFSTNNANICTVAQGGMDANGVMTGTVSITGGGTCQITANQPGNGFFNSASDTGSFTIQKLSQTISGLDPIPPKISTDPPFAITTTTSSGLQPVFTATGFCTVGQVILLDNNTTQARVTITGGNGTCTITAQQPGNNIYNPSNTLSQSFTISKANQTLSFNLPPQYTLEQSSYTFTATASSGLLVTFTTAGQCTINNAASSIITGGVTLATLNLTGEGSCSVTAVQAGNTFYNSTNSITDDISIGKASQSITFPPLDDKLTTDLPFVVSATASSGLPVTFTVTGNCTASGTNGSTISITGAGSCTVTARQAGNTQYSPALNVSQGFQISKASQTIDFAPIPDKAAGDPPFVLTATASSGLPVTYTTSGSCVVSGTLASLTGTGTCSITATQSGNQTYTAASKIQTFVIIQSNQTISFPAPGNHLASDPPFPVTATASSGLTITFTAQGACTVSAGTLGANKTTSATVGITGTGNCTLTAQQSGNVTYTAAAPVARTFSIAQSSQSITFDPISTKSYTETTFPITATASSGLQVTFSAAGGICSVDAGTLAPNGVTTTTVNISAPGSCTITAQQSGNLTYTAAPPVSQTFSVTGFTQTISFDSLPAKSFGDAPFPVTATASSGLQVTFVTNTDVCVASDTHLSANTVPSATVATLTLVAGGSCVITATQPGNFQYFAAPPVSQTVPIGKVPQKITFNRPPDKQVGDPDFPVTATVNSGLIASFSASGACTVASQSNANSITTAIIHITGGGSCTITASQPGNNIWAPAPDVSYTIGIGLLSQTIDFPPISNKLVTDTQFPITATTNYSLPVSFTAGSPCSVLTGTIQPNGVTSSTVTITGAGTCTITANAAGDANHAAATPVQRSFTINKLSQSIDLPQIKDHPASDQHFTITATATSGLTVTFQASGVCTVSTSSLSGKISSAEVTLTGSGSCSITAQQGGNGQYSAAPQVTRTFNSNGVAQVITFNPLPNRMLGDPPFTITAEASSHLTVTFDTVGPCSITGGPFLNNGVTTATVSMTGGGRCTITAHQAGNGIFPPAADVSQSFLIFSTNIYIPITLRNTGSGW